MVFYIFLLSTKKRIRLRPVDPRRTLEIISYFFTFSSVSLFPALALAATRPPRASSAITFGMTMSWLNISVSSHTRSLDRIEPRKMKAIAMIEYGRTAFLPNRYSMLIRPSR